MEIFLILAALLAFSRKNKASNFGPQNEDPSKPPVPTVKDIQAILDRYKAPQGYPVLFNAIPTVPGLIHFINNNVLYKITVANNNVKWSAVPDGYTNWLNYFYSLSVPEMNSKVNQLILNNDSAFNSFRDMANLISYLKGIQGVYGINIASNYMPVNWPAQITIQQLSNPTGSSGGPSGGGVSPSGGGPSGGGPMPTGGSPSGSGLPVPSTPKSNVSGHTA